MNTRIKEVRLAANLAQAAFGEALGLSQNYIWMIEAGKREPSERTIRDICREYGVNENWLRTGEGEMYVVRTVEDALGDLFDAVTADEPDAFRKRVFLGLANLSPEDWETVERILNTMMGKKEEPGQ